jgi:hypothetical protein
MLCAASYTCACAEEAALETPLVTPLLGSIVTDWALGKHLDLTQTHKKRIKSTAQACPPETFKVNLSWHRACYFPDGDLYYLARRFGRLITTVCLRKKNAALSNDTVR